MSVFPREKVVSSLFFLVVGLFSSAVFSAAGDDDPIVPASAAQQLLQRMADAHQQLSYKGRFTYEHGGVLRTMEVVRSMQDGLAVERLIHLNGPKRELVRHQGEINCQSPGEVLLRGMPLDFGVGDYRQLTDNYELVLKGKDRIAARPVDVLHIVPKDKYRYGYSLAIDEATGILMQSLLIDSGKKVLERFQFVNLDVEKVSSYQHQLADSPCVSTAQKIKESSHYQVTWLPPGFVLSGYQPKTEQQSETLVFTDGLAVFSLFIESQGAQPLPEVQAQRGATVAFLMHKQQEGKHYRVAVVGEIPPATARTVAQSLLIERE